MLRRKKGIAMGRLVIWIIILFSFVMIAFTIERFISKAEPLEAEILCRDSLALKANLEIDIGLGKVSTPALCKTIDKKFEGKKEDEALDWFTRSMERCWWIWLEGRYPEMFGSNGIFRTDEKTKCFVCNTLTYKDGPTISKTDLLDNLEKTSSKYAKGNVLSYIQKRGYVDIYEDIFPSDQVYALVFASNIETLREIYPFILVDTEGTKKQNGLWLMSLNRYDKVQPCYNQPDIAGE